MSSKDTVNSDGRSQDNEVNQEGHDSSGSEPAARDPDKVREIGGRKGPDPTRYGDWEKAGRCIDF
jgi:hypothetical protein